MKNVIMHNKNTPLLVLDIEGTKVLKIKEVLDRKRLPIILENDLSEESLNKWIEKRIIPEKRDKINITRKYYPKFENYKNMFSLSDQYWFQYDKKESWKKLNFFNNDYSSVIGELFFTPWDFSDDDLTSHSPDLTTNGVLKKVWKKEGKDSYLYKAGSKDYHQEPLSEVLASITLERLNFIPFVKYELAINGLELCSKCKNFIDENTEFVPASYIYSKEPRKESSTIYEHLIKMCELYGIDGSEEYLNNMIAADKIIGNDDRHLGNFGFLRNVESAEIIGFAPLFDSGSAYWGKASAFKKARLFSEKEDVALQKALDKINLGMVLNHEEMFRLINMYPKIGKSKRDEIKKRILLSEEELEKSAILLNGGSEKNQKKNKIKENEIGER